MNGYGRLSQVFVGGGLTMVTDEEAKRLWQALSSGKSSLIGAFSLLFSSEGYGKVFSFRCPSARGNTPSVTDWMSKLAVWKIGSDQSSMRLTAPGFTQG